MELMIKVYLEVCLASHHVVSYPQPLLCATQQAEKRKLLKAGWPKAKGSRLLESLMAIFVLCYLGQKQNKLVNSCDHCIHYVLVSHEILLYSTLTKTFWNQLPWVICLVLVIP